MVVNLFHVIDGNDLFGGGVSVLSFCFFVTPLVPLGGAFSRKESESRWFDSTGTEFSVAAKTPGVIGAEAFSPPPS